MTAFLRFHRATENPDIKLLNDNYIRLIRMLPRLLETLQP